MGYKKYYLYKRQESVDGGETWSDIFPLETAPSGNPIGTYSTLAECEGLFKFRATYLGGATYELPCDGNSSLTQSEVRGGYAYSALTDAVIGNCVTVLEYQPFLWCNSLSSVTIADSVLDLGAAFYGCRSLKSISIPHTTQIINHQCFLGCRSLTEIYIPDSVTYLGSSVFMNCYGLKTAIIGNGVQEIMSSAFGSCTGLTSVEIGSSVQTIGEYAFYECTSLASIDIPSGVTSIGDDAFELCSGMTSVTIGSGVTSIGGKAFNYCTSLASITCLATTPPTLEASYVFNQTNDAPIYVPAASVSAYQTAWSDYTSRIQAIPT